MKKVLGFSECFDISFPVNQHQAMPAKLTPAQSKALEALRAMAPFPRGEFLTGLNATTLDSLKAKGFIRVSDSICLGGLCYDLELIESPLG